MDWDRVDYSHSDGTHSLQSRLAAIDDVGGDTGVKPQHRYGTIPRLDFFYSNKNYLVQLEDTTIKTECSCSMQRTERTRALHHSSLGLHWPRLSWPDFAAGLISRIQRGSG